MKANILSLVLCALWLNVIAQAPQKMSYQAVIRDAGGKLVKNQSVGMHITILEGALPGTSVYEESQTPATNENGLVTIEIGGGTGFDVIDWGNGIHFIKTEIDPSGGTNYTITGTTQLLSVPYALYSKTSETTKDAATKSDIYALEEKILLLAAEIGVKDIHGNSYKTVKIGTQVWMAEDLKTTKYKDGNQIPLVTSNTEWANLTTPGYCWYNNDQGTYGNTYGALYNWYAVNTGKLCPAGWHIPTNEEWTTLTTFLGGENVAGGKMKETGTSHWNIPNTGATNVSGFSALPGGLRTSGGSFVNVGNLVLYASSSEYSSSLVWCRQMQNSDTRLFTFFSGEKAFGYTVRCLRDQ